MNTYESSEPLPTWRLWGEEQNDGIIYTVYLKKVRYQKPLRSVVASNDNEDDISHLEWETVRIRFVKGGTLQKLVETLILDDGELESTYVNIFLATYRTFSTPNEVLTLLFEQFEEIFKTNNSNFKKHKKAIVSVLYIWLDSYPEDFRDPPSHCLLQQLLHFCCKYLPGNDLELKVKHLFNQYSQEDLEDIVNLKVCPAIALRTASANVAASKVYRFPNIPVRHFAEQLTRMDMELFKKLIPHQCLGSIWSKRDKSRSHEAATVLATVNQFNAVSFRVISSILVDKSLKPIERSQLLVGWIDIAQELRILKNFSSLKAIISGLQSNVIYRLTKTWQFISKEKIHLYKELANIFSEDNNQWKQRELLMREGTAKFANFSDQKDKKVQKMLLKQQNDHNRNSFGTIPYLGTFLTDLVMVDTAIPDTIDSYVNFDKKRKEFEVLAQIKLLQGSVNSYHLSVDHLFDRWFDSILILDDTEAFHLSCQIEPIADPKMKKKKNHKKNESIASNFSGNSFQFLCDATELSHSSSNSSLDRHSNEKSMNNSTCSTISQKSGHDCYIIKVSFESNASNSDGVVVYKSILLSNSERTPQVIRNAMLKLGLQGDPDSYTLSQVLSNKKEMILPINANVYYAKNQHIACFRLIGAGESIGHLIIEVELSRLQKYLQKCITFAVQKMANFVNLGSMTSNFVPGNANTSSIDT